MESIKTYSPLFILKSNLMKEKYVSTPTVALSYIGCKFIYCGTVKTCAKQYIGDKGSVVIEFTNGVQAYLSALELVVTEL